MNEFIDLSIYLQTRFGDEFFILLSEKYPDYRDLSKIEVSRLVIKELNENGIFPLIYGTIEKETLS